MGLSDRPPPVRVAGAALLAGVATWLYLGWVTVSSWRPSVLVLLQVSFLVLIPCLAAGAATAFRPKSSEWLPAGVAAAAAMAFIFAQHAYNNSIGFDISREVVLSSAAYTFVISLCAGSALVLATFVAARWQTLTAAQR